MQSKETEWIRGKKAELDALLESSVTPGVFTLNKNIEGIYAEIASLQKQCPHEFEQGRCKNCGLEESNE